MNSTHSQFHVVREKVHNSIIYETGVYLIRQHTTHTFSSIRCALMRSKITHRFMLQKINFRLDYEKLKLISQNTNHDLMFVVGAKTLTFSGVRLHDALIFFLNFIVSVGHDICGVSCVLVAANAFDIII